jgi:excisionase family DNA binding protein
MPEEIVPEKRVGPLEFERLLDTHEAALLLNVHPETVKRMARRGDLAAVKFGKIWRFRVLALEECVRRMTQRSRSRRHCCTSLSLGVAAHHAS